MSSHQFGHIQLDDDETPRHGGSMDIQERSLTRGSHDGVCCSTKKCVLVILIQLLLIGGLFYYLKGQNLINSTLVPQQSQQEQEGAVSVVGEKEDRPNSIPPKNEERKPIQQSPAKEQKPLNREEQSKLKWPDDKPDFNIEDSFNLWDISPQEKVQLLHSYKNLPAIQRPAMSQQFLEINYDKDEEFLPFAIAFQQDLEVVDWASLPLSDSRKLQLSQNHKTMLQKRENLINSLFAKYKELYMGKEGFLDAKKGITYEVFLDSLETQKLTGQDFQNQEEFKAIHQREQIYHYKKFGTQQFDNELHACVVAPTYNNNKDYRYAWHIQSLFQQDYDNYRVIIIDDFSTDGTGDKIAQYLSWRQLPQDKFILLKNKVHRTALENIYYATHKYCDFNQIAFIVDGDDELVGTQVFKMYNALYQRSKMYVLYSNFISYDSYYPNNPLSIGISEQYPFRIIESVEYRTYSHSYSHLRTMMTDLFLFERVESLKDAVGKFYWTLYDNAIYYPALEMSCGRVTYVPELKYWYTANTGINDWRTPRKEEYKGVAKHISKQQKRYHCINSVFQVMKEVIENGPKH